MTDTLLIVIPVYQEGENIRRTLAEIEARIRTPHTILLIYDFPEDNTVPAAEEFIREHQAAEIKMLPNRYGGGVLNAILTGFHAAGDDDIVLVMMADLSDDLVIVDRMFARIKEGYDIVCGSRYARGGRHLGGPRLKKLLSRTAGVTLHLFTGIPTHDISNSFKMYRSRAVKDIRIESRGGFEVGMEMVVKSFLAGRRITEIPSTWRDRVAGKSRFKLRKWLPEYLRWYLYALRGSLARRWRPPTA